MDTDSDEPGDDSTTEDNFNDSIPLSSRQRTKVCLVYSYKILKISLFRLIVIYKSMKVLVNDHFVMNPVVFDISVWNHRVPICLNAKLINIVERN